MDFLAALLHAHAQDGKLRRPGWTSDTFVTFDQAWDQTFVRRIDSDGDLEFTLADLLASDWEVVS